MRNIIIIGCLAAIVFSTTACNKELRKIEKTNNVEQKLAYANKMYEKKKYNMAQTLYDELIPVFKGTDKFEQLYYNYAYCSYYLKDYMQATFHFKNYLEAFPSSPRAMEIDYMQAYSYYKLSPKASLDQTNTIKAIAAMQTFIDTYPNSDKSAEASLVIEMLRKKLELKEFNACELYYNIGHYKAAGVAFTNLMRNYPDSEKSDQYKYLAIKAYYLYAKNSIFTKQHERYDRVVSEYKEFLDRYPQSSLKNDAEKYYNLAVNNIKSLENEQNKEISNQ